MNSPTESSNHFPWDDTGGIPRFLLKGTATVDAQGSKSTLALQAPSPSEVTTTIAEPVEVTALASGQPLTFAGDTGTLRLDTRRCVVALLAGPSVDGRRQSSLWAVLVRDRAVLQSRLHDLFLELVVDVEQQVAFIRQIVHDDGESIPILLRRQQLTFIESALVLYLRQRLTEADSANERAVVAMQDMLDHLGVFEKAQNTDGVKFDKQCAGAVEKCKTLNLIRPIRASEGRFEISPTLKLLFSAEDIQALMASYESLKAPAEDGDETSLDAAIAKGISEGETVAELLDEGD